MIRIREIRQLTGYAPSQWTGLTDAGESLYIRYRHGWLSVEVGDDTVFDKQIGDEHGGVISLFEVGEFVDLELPHV